MSKTTTHQEAMRMASERAFKIADLREVIKAQEAMARAGHHVPKLGQYLDELLGLLGGKS